MKKTKLLTLLAIMVAAAAMAIPVMADLAPGVTLDFNASDPASGVSSSAWNSLTADQSRNWSPGADVSLVDASSGLAISKAYRFTGGNGANASSWTNYDESADATWELWIKPAGTGSGNQVIFETGGGGTGMAIYYDQGAGTINFLIDAGTPVRTVSAAIGTAEFSHVVCVYNKDLNGNDLMQIWVDGVLVDEVHDINNLDKWSGTDGAGLGHINSGIGSNMSGGNFNGDLAVLRFWENKALTAAEVTGNFGLYSGASITVIYPENGAVVPSGDVILEWENIDDPCSTDPVYADVWWGTDPNRFNGGYTQAGAGENITSATITPAGPGVYYWYVDNTIGFGGADPCTIEGSVYMFTNDGPIASVNAGPDMVTWEGEPVGLIAGVDDDGGSALTYSWTADLPNGVTAVFNPSADVADAAVTFTRVPYTNATIVNAGFEAEQLDEDGWGSAPGWTAIGRKGSWNPPADAYTDSAVPEGIMCGWAQTTTGGLTQVLAETLAADTEYVLTVEVGNSLRYDWTGYKVQLLAGGTVIAEDNSTLTPAVGTFETSTVAYSYDAVADANKVGLPLEIRMLAGALAPAYAECNFDDVKLTADPAFPVPAGASSVDITLTVKDEINPGVSDTMTIDIYGDACQAARVGLGMDIQADLNGNCQVYPEDLATMAENWLNTDKELDLAVTNPANNWPGNIFSVSFYRFGGAMDTEEERAKMLLTDDEAAGYGDWLTTGWVNIEAPWSVDGNDETPDTITSTGGSTASFYFHDTRNGNNYNDNLSLMVEGTNAEMMEGHSNGTMETPGLEDLITHIELADIPFAAYDLIFYIGTQGAQEGDGTGKYSLNGAPYADFARPVGRFDGTFQQVNDGVSTSGNYILFEGVTGSSFNFKIHGTGFNHIGLSGFQVRETDPNAPVVSAGNSWITWLGEPVTLEGTIDGTNSLWNMEDTTFTWTADTAEWMDAAVTGSETMNPTVTLSRVVPYFWEVPIENPSFEAPVLADPDGRYKWFMTGESTWRFADPDGTAFTTEDNKGYFGQMFLWNPGVVDAGNWNGASFDGEVPDGVNCVIVGSILRSGAVGPVPASEYPGGLAQLLTTTYDPTASYELSAYIGHSGLAFSTQGGYKVELLAGGTNEDSSNQYTHKVVGGTVIGSVESTDPIDPNTWEQVTVSVQADSANADLAGEPLQIRITSLRIPNDPNTTYVCVDDVKLVTDAPKALEPVKMALTVTEQSTGNSTSGVTLIDVYENPCLAAVAANPGMEFDLSDITEDCITNLVDFAILASDWLLDYELTAAEPKTAE